MIAQCLSMKVPEAKKTSERSTAHTEAPAMRNTIYTVRQHALWKLDVSAEGAASYQPGATPQGGWCLAGALKARFNP